MSTISFDFDSIKARIKSNLSAKSQWASFLEYGVADNIIDPIAQELAYAMQYNEYLTYENLWAKARNKSSLLVQSPVHGYKVPRKQGAIGTLRVSTDSNFGAVYSGGVSIPLTKFFQFSGNSIYVVADNTYTISAPDTYIDIGCKQGETKTVTFSATGATYETKLIEDDSVDNAFFELYVNGIEWTCVDTLFEYGEDDLVYEVQTKPDLSGVILRFGNNIFGRKLEANDQIVFKYITTKGADGNIYSPSIIDTVETQAFDANGKPVKLYVKNTTAIIGGADYPTLEEIRTLSPKVYQTGDRASNADDYTTKIKQFTYISKVNVWGAYEVLKDANKDPWNYTALEENVVHLALLDNTYSTLTDTEKEQVIEDLHAKCDPTDLISFEDVEKIPLIFNISAVVKNSSYTLIQVKSNIEQALTDNYAIADTSFSQNIYNSDFISLIDAVTGVRNHTSSILIKKEGSFLTEAYVGSFTLPIYPIDYTKVALYVENLTDATPTYVKFATCDENGNLVGTTGYNTNGSNINLTTGVGALVINSGLTDTFSNYQIKILYAGSDVDLVLNNRYDIFAYDSSNITVAYPSN